MYKLVKSNKNPKQKMGYKGKEITDENVNSYPERILKIWLKAKLIKEVKGSTKKE